MISEGGEDDRIGVCLQAKSAALEMTLGNRR